MSDAFLCNVNWDEHSRYIYFQGNNVYRPWYSNRTKLIEEVNGWMAVHNNHSDFSDGVVKARLCVPYSEDWLIVWVAEGEPRQSRYIEDLSTFINTSELWSFHGEGEHSQSWSPGWPRGLPHFRDLIDELKGKNKKLPPI